MQVRRKGKGGVDAGSPPPRAEGVRTWHRLGGIGLQGTNEAQEGPVYSTWGPGGSALLLCEEGATMVPPKNV